MPCQPRAFFGRRRNSRLSLFPIWTMEKKRRRGILLVIVQERKGDVQFSLFSLHWFFEFWIKLDCLLLGGSSAHSFICAYRTILSGHKGIKSFFLRFLFLRFRVLFVSFLLLSPRPFLSPPPPDSRKHRSGEAAAGLFKQNIHQNSPKKFLHIVYIVYAKSGFNFLIFLTWKLTSSAIFRPPRGHLHSNLHKQGPLFLFHWF